MALVLLTPPPQSLAALAPMLAPTGARHVNSLRAFAAQTTPSQVTSPMPVYVVGLASLVAHRAAADAQLVGWRFIIDKGIDNGAGRKLAAEVAYDPATGQYAFASLNEGPFVDDTPVRVAAAHAAPGVAEGDYELRLLRIPALHVVALWLEDRRGSADQIIPLAPCPAPLVAGHAYTMADVEMQLAPQAVIHLQFDARPKP